MHAAVASRIPWHCFFVFRYTPCGWDRYERHVGYTGGQAGGARWPGSFRPRERTAAERAAPRDAVDCAPGCAPDSVDGDAHGAAVLRAGDPCRARIACFAARLDTGRLPGLRVRTSRLAGPLAGSGQGAAGKTSISECACRDGPSDTGDSGRRVGVGPAVDSGRRHPVHLFPFYTALHPLPRLLAVCLCRCDGLCAIPRRRLFSDWTRLHELGPRHSGPGHVEFAAPIFDEGRAHVGPPA